MDPWRRPAALAWLLWPASFVFAVVVALRRFLYRVRIFKSAHPGIPVIVVGNITVGGSGKTPLVIWVAELLRAKGWHPGIISRGYGGKVTGPRAATIADEASEVGDEPIILSRRSGCPVWVGADRVAVAAALRATALPEEASDCRGRARHRRRRSRSRARARDAAGRRRG